MSILLSTPKFFIFTGTYVPKENGLTLYPALDKSAALKSIVVVTPIDAAKSASPAFFKLIGSVISL